MTYSTPSSQQPLPNMGTLGGLPDMSQRGEPPDMRGGLPDMCQKGGLFCEYPSPDTLKPSVASYTATVSSPCDSSSAFGSQLSVRSGIANKG